MAEASKVKRHIVLRDWVGDAETRIARASDVPTRVTAAAVERSAGPGRTLGLALLRRGRAAGRRGELARTIPTPERRLGLRRALAPPPWTRPLLTIQQPIAPPSSLHVEPGENRPQNVQSARPSRPAGPRVGRWSEAKGIFRRFLGQERQPSRPQRAAAVASRDGVPFAASGRSNAPHAARRSLLPQQPDDREAAGAVDEADFPLSPREIQGAIAPGGDEPLELAAAVSEELAVTSAEASGTPDGEESRPDGLEAPTEVAPRASAVTRPRRPAAFRSAGQPAGDRVSRIVLRVTQGVRALTLPGRDRPGSAETPPLADVEQVPLSREGAAMPARQAPAGGPRVPATAARLSAAPARILRLAARVMPGRAQPRSASVGATPPAFHAVSPPVPEEAAPAPGPSGAEPSPQATARQQPVGRRIFRWLPAFLAAQPSPEEPAADTATAGPDDGDPVDTAPARASDDPVPAVSDAGVSSPGPRPDEALRSGTPQEARHSGAPQGAPRSSAPHVLRRPAGTRPPLERPVVARLPSDAETVRHENRVEPVPQPGIQGLAPSPATDSRRSLSATPKRLDVGAELTRNDDWRSGSASEPALAAVEDLPVLLPPERQPAAFVEGVGHRVLAVGWRKPALPRPSPGSTGRPRRRFPRVSARPSALRAWRHRRARGGWPHRPSLQVQWRSLPRPGKTRILHHASPRSRRSRSPVRAVARWRRWGPRAGPMLPLKTAKQKRARPLTRPPASRAPGRLNHSPSRSIGSCACVC